MLGKNANLSLNGRFIKYLFFYKLKTTKNQRKLLILSLFGELPG